MYLNNEEKISRAADVKPSPSVFTVEANRLLTWTESEVFYQVYLPVRSEEHTSELQSR